MKPAYLNSKKILIITAMRNIIAAVLFATLAAGCGGQISRLPVDDPTPHHTPTPAPTPSVTITANSVFSPSMVGQDWTFTNGYGDTNHILIENPQAFTRTNPDGSTTEMTWTDTGQVSGRTGITIVWHFASKSADRTYWGMRVHSAELFFPIHIEPNGSGRSTSSAINMPSGCPWCLPSPSSAFINTFQVLDTQAGMALPYLITPPTVSTGDHFVNETRVCSPGVAGLTFDNTTPGNPLCGPTDGEYWRTDFYQKWVTTPLYTGWATVSDQFEGICGHELWYFAPVLGLVRIESPYDGGEVKGDPQCSKWPVGDHVQINGVWTHDPNLTITRIQ